MREVAGVHKWRGETVPTVPMGDERRDGGETPRRGGEGGRGEETGRNDGGERRRRETEALVDGRRGGETGKNDGEKRQGE